MSVHTGEILPTTQQKLLRPLGAQVHFSDVFPRQGATDTAAWWRSNDFDAPLTVQLESGEAAPNIYQVPIGERPWVVPYGLVLLDDLLHARGNRVARNQAANNRHPDAISEINRHNNLATIALANYAPRDEAHTQGGKNGSDFLLAITTSGLEVYATPASFLSSLEARNRITALYRIPTKGHPEFDGEHEQFRSARVVRTRQHPDHLEPLFEYDSVEDLARAKQAAAHPNHIPLDTRPGRFAFIDTFGNVKIELQDTNVLRQAAVGELLRLVVHGQGETHELDVVAACDLASAPSDRLAIYTNCSDQFDTSSSVGLAELMVRVNDNPSTSQNTAAFKLLRAIPGLDIGNASVELKTA